MPLAESAISFIDHYGYAALFVLLALETAMILHFVPSELIITVAAARLATSPWTLALVVLVAGAASTTGSLLLYAVARYGGGPILERYPRLFGGRERAERMKRWFERPAGEFLVFALRLLPFFRAVVSIPAGLVRMDLAKFTAYSAAGNLLFALALAYAAYARHGWLAALRERWPLFLLLALVLLALLVWAWLRRRHLRERPAHEVARAWKGAALIVTAAALALLLFALLAPHLATALVDAIAIDRAEWVRARGLAPVVNALLLAGELLIAGLLALALSRAVATLAHRIARRLGP